MVVQDSSSVCVVGSFSLDSIIVPGRVNFFHNLGGATAFTSFAVKALGVPVSVVSRVGGDFPKVYLEQLRESGIDVSAVKRYLSEFTTRFELCYNDDFSERTLKLVCKGCPISLDDIPKGLYAKAIHVAPIAGELSYEIMHHLKSCCTFLSLDPQGFLRHFDADGVVTLCSSDKRVLDLIDVCKVSLDELFVLTGFSDLKAAIRAVHDVGVKTIIVTMGAKGSLLSVEGVCCRVPAYLSSVIVDPTGAGDVFIGAFLAEYLKGSEPLWCASVGSAAASFVVEGLGSTYMGNQDQIYHRAQTIYKDKVKE